MIGFIAGFPYLGGMSKEIATPRLKSPRVKIEGGSVGIAGEQTGIYPVASPGGWQLIGRTPLKLYDADREKPVLLEAGQYIKFAAVTEEEYKKIEKEVEDGTYKYVVYDKEAVSYTHLDVYKRQPVRKLRKTRAVIRNTGLRRSAATTRSGSWRLPLRGCSKTWIITRKWNIPAGWQRRWRMKSRTRSRASAPAFSF